MSNIARMMQRATAGAGGAGLDVDEVFSTFLYEGNGGTQTITNGIDLTEGGLVWSKDRDTGAAHNLADTVRGGTKALFPHNTSVGLDRGSNYITSFNSNGYSIGADGLINDTYSYVSWTFRKAPKFFDVVTYTGNGNSSNTISHNLGSIPGFVVVKRTNGTGDWHTAARQSNGSYIHGNASYPTALNLTSAGNAVTSTNGASDMSLTSTTFDAKKINGYNSHNGSGNLTNINGATYVAYLFAHHDDDGGFGAAGDQDIIKCGSYTGNGNATGPVVDLGFEPQWLLVKDATSTNDWFIWDVMRGFPANVANSLVSLNPNTADAEQAEYGTAPQPTGFQVTDNNAAINTNNNTYIYMAIRRGGMQTPTAASSVFNVGTYSSNSDSNVFNTGFAADMAITTRTSGTNNYNLARLMGSYYLWTDGNNAEGDVGTQWYASNNSVDFDTSFWGTTSDTVTWSWKRARGFFDVVAWKGAAGSLSSVKHNLGVTPDLVMLKYRGATDNWYVYNSATTGALILDTNGATLGSTNYMASTTATDLNVSLVSNPANSPIAYLFATLAGVSKVGSFTQSGATNVACGFTGSTPALIILKRTDASGDWYLFDYANGIVSGNDPYGLLNSDAAQVTNADIVDPYSGGFATTSSLTDGDYIFYAIAAIS